MLNKVQNNKLELSTQILINEAKNNGIDVEILDPNDNFIRLIKGERVEYVKQATKTSCDNYVSVLIMENKLVSKIILREHGIQVPDGVVADNYDDATHHFVRFQKKDTVVKPNSTNFGKGVIILKSPYQKDEFEKAVMQAFDFDDTVLIEEFIDGKEYRFLVIGNEVVGVLHRVPANVIGDGVKTIEKLVASKNEDPLRGEGYVLPLEKIKLGQIEQEYLRLQGLAIDSIPLAGQTIYLRENSNISTGGDSIDFTDDVLDSYKKIAVDAAKAVDAKICGVDIIIKDIKAQPDMRNYSIIELNFNPALHIHEFPAVGQGRKAARKVLELLDLI